ncbi:MAG: acyl-[ACP]--phospholipid O-acyltransferase [Bryobacteraceae bacterium]|jgi:acyl-[acyl-carrier-protein]-phospholipid O-acyltransferase/long-chain-fatty-acid--[acyl-carrier-protein] ligase
MRENSGSLLKARGVQCFLWTQFLGAFNDNLLMLVVSFLAARLMPKRSEELIALTGAVFFTPFFLFSGYAGRLADVFSKRTILVAVKCFEIVVMLVVFVVLPLNRLDLLLGMVFLMGLHSTLFSPAKYGIVPELLPDKDLSRANGLLEMTTFLAIILGTSAAGVMVEFWQQTPSKIGLALLAVAVAGTASSLGISRVPASGSTAPFRWNPWGEVGSGLRRLFTDKPLWLTVLAISYFFCLGTLLKMDLLVLGRKTLGVSEGRTATLYTFLAIGIGIGSVVAGRLSGDKVELGLVPLGSLGMGVFSLQLVWWAHSYPGTAVSLMLLGFSGGLFAVPLHAYLQQRSGTQERGRLIATNNFLNTLGMLIAAGSLSLFGAHLHFTPQAIILVFGLLTLLATGYAVSVVPEFLIRFVLWLLTHSLYRIRIVGQHYVPFRGPALLVCNHMSHVDSFLVGACIQRFVRFLVYRPYYERKAFHWILTLMKAIPVAASPPRQALASLRCAREELLAGHVVCIFAEGSISRIGNMLPFKSGFTRIVRDLDVPVIPVHIDRLWGSIFSFKKGRFFWKRPERLPFPVTVSFGRPLPSTASAQEVRQAVMELGSAAVHYRRTSHDLLHLRFIRTAKRRWFSFCMADSSGKELTFGRALAGAMLLARWLLKQRPAEEMLGLLLPASVGGALANIAVFLAGKVPVNLNFTAGPDAMHSAVRRCEIRTILTSRIFLARARIEPQEEMVFLEDLLQGIHPATKVLAVLAAFLTPARLLERHYNAARRDPDYLATVVFSSGSTGAPKGIMLSHHNIISNIEALAQVFWVTRGDRFLGVLPFFHSFGFTCTLWFPLVEGFGVVYHPNPMDAKGVGEMAEKHRITFLLSTPTFYSTYLRKCTREQFATVRFAFTGGEKLRASVARPFLEKFGLSLCEGYGCTEMAPVVSANILNYEGEERQTGFKPGTVGHPIPGVVAKVVDPDTGETLPAGKTGLLLVNGPSRMIGYLGSPQQTAEALREGWYDTGDIACIDEEGFIEIKDRLSRFSKIGGEMVPHIKLEEAINETLGDYSCAVTAVPDEQKGEKLVVFYTHKEISSQQLWELVSESNLPKLWIPKPENFHCIETLPTLGSGKLDLKRVKEMARGRTAGGDK